MTTQTIQKVLPNLSSVLPHVKGQRVLVRADLNVPLDETTGGITDDTRIRASLPTLQALVAQGAKVILTSHLGRPKGKAVESMRLAPVHQALQALLPQVPVAYVPEVVGEQVTQAVSSLQEGSILLLENLRFDPREEKNDATLAEALGQLADVFVNDAFGAAHRAHASTHGIVAHVPKAVAGYLLEKEVAMLSAVTQNPQRPLGAVIGGSKVSSKITVLTNLLDKVNVMVIGGGMAYTFFLAQGLEVGKSIVEPDQVALAKAIMEKANALGVTLVLPEDIKVADAFDNEANTKVVPAHGIPATWEGLDAGPVTQQRIQEALSGCKTILWNGPVGKFEFSNFSHGTRRVAEVLVALTQQGVQTVLGGGDTVAAIEGFGIAPESFTHVSTGGGASLEFLEGKALPGIEALLQG
ncbi:MAG: phosphoglycerate kinase [Vampirovibrionales bacterium]